jgi:hypothetical protein
MEDWVTQLIGTIGVPGAICFFVLTRLQTTIDQNTKVIAMLCAKMGVNENGSN